MAPAAGGPLDIVADGVTGFLYDPLDDAELTAVVAGLIEEPDLAREMGDRGRIAVEGRSWAAICDELIGHYRHAMAEVLQPA